METFAILVTGAFVLGYLAKLIGLPPLVGFLAAGFGLNAMGFEKIESLNVVADVGVTLLLFSIGLKLKIRGLLQPAVWAGASLHMMAMLLLGSLLFWSVGFGVFAELDFRTAALIAFALSFSSTVFAVKTFEEQGESASLFARTAIGVLIMQDVIAVIFLAASKGAMPSPWAVTLIALYFLRPALKHIARRSGHGELLLLMGMIMPLGGWAWFEAVNLKGDLGALIIGMLIADHPKAKEMASKLLSLKDMLLVGFFLNIGLSGLPTIQDLGIATLLVCLIPIKLGLYFLILTRFRLRARTSFMASLGLCNYSEFGLIVGALGVKMGWLSDQWLVIIAVAVAITFVLASPLNTYAHHLYTYLRSHLTRFETKKRLEEEQAVDIGDAEVIIFGMGRIGTMAYHGLQHAGETKLVGLDADPESVKTHRAQGRNVIQDDPTDTEFWDHTSKSNSHIRLILLAMPSQRANMVALQAIQKFKGRENMKVLAAARFDDEASALKEAGAEEAYHVYATAGQGYADAALAMLKGEAGLGTDAPTSKATAA